MSRRGNEWRRRSVLLTGHTGFKGGWLALWLHKRGALVHGYSLEPPTQPSMFEVASIQSVLATDTRADICDLATLKRAFKSASPEVVFHMAAQPLVRESYRDPVGTLKTNVIGTSQVLEAARTCESIRAIVVITTDKVYKDDERGHPHREADALGATDPYSASKAAAEIVTASYRDSFFCNREGSRVRIATARAGNVLGGGDWAAERLVPDCMRAFQSNSAVRLRKPNSLRPWQHVLEPLSGYLQLAEALMSADADSVPGAWNFGPAGDSDATVREVAALAARFWGGGARVEEAPDGDGPPERDYLRLDSTLACEKLGWRPRWSLDETLRKTVAWYREWLGRADMCAFSLSQIDTYESQLTA